MRIKSSPCEKCLEQCKAHCANSTNMISIEIVKKSTPHPGTFSGKLPVYPPWNTPSLKLGLSKFSQYLNECKKALWARHLFSKPNRTFSSVGQRDTQLLLLSFYLTCIFFHLKQVYFSYRLRDGSSQWGISRGQFRGFKLPS